MAELTKSLSPNKKKVKHFKLVQTTTTKTTFKSGGKKSFFHSKRTK